MIHHLRLLTVALLGPILSAGLTAQTSVRLVPVADAVVRSDQPTKNFGSATELGLSKDQDASGNTFFLRSYFRFDASSLKGKPVRKAQLYFYENRTSGAGGLPVEAFGVTQAFTESKVTWSSKPTDDGKVLNSVKVGDNFNRGWKVFDISPLVQRWAGGATNHGVVIRLKSESTAGARRPSYGPSREFATTTLRPYLLVDTTAAVSFDKGCGPVATWPRLAVTAGAPKINTKMTLTGSLLAPSSPALIVVGVSNSTWGGVKLPLVLDATVGPPCQLLVSLDLLVGGATDSSGKRVLSVTVPNDPKSVGLHIYVQMATLGKATHFTEGLDLLLH